MRVLHVDPATGWRGGQAQLAALFRSRPGDLWAGAEGGQLETRLGRAPDVPLHADVGVLNALRVRAAARRLGVDLVAAHSSHAHDACLLTRAPLVVHRRNHRLPGHVWKYAGARVTVAVSAWVASRCRAAGVPRVVVVHDGADGVYVGARTSAGPPVYLVAAALVPHKGHAQLLDAFSDVEGELLIAGSGPLDGALRAQAAPLGDRVRFLGQVADPSALFRAVDVLVLPSIEEAAGSVLIEGMAAGLAVVASAVGGIPELVGQAGALVRPGDRRGWVDALRMAPGTGGRATVAWAARFSTAEMVRRTEAVYREALTGSVQ
ncbi:MAG: glycosyltransferase [Myxococcales bacterium]|nr:glycosyltransferase [Myxococcales bacterium]